MRLGKPSLLMVVAVVFFASCGDGAGSGAGDPAFAGTVTVSDSALWEDVRIGFFSAGTEGAYPYLDTTGTPPVLRYFESGGPVDVALEPEVPPLTFTASSAVARNYVLYLPGRVPTELVEQYYVVAWIDSGGDGRLRLLNQSDGAGGDARYFSTRNTTLEGEPVTVTVTHVQKDIFSFGENDSGFKYVGTVPGHVDPFNEALENRSNPGFNFEITVP